MTKDVRLAVRPRNARLAIRCFDGQLDPPKPTPLHPKPARKMLLPTETPAVSLISKNSFHWNSGCSPSRWQASFRFSAVRRDIGVIRAGSNPALDRSTDCAEPWIFVLVGCPARFRAPYFNRPRSPRGAGLPVQLQPKLDLPLAGRSRARELAGVGNQIARAIEDLHFRSLEVWLVEQVESFCPELQTGAFAK